MEEGLGGRQVMITIQVPEKLVDFCSTTDFSIFEIKIYEKSSKTSYLLTDNAGEEYYLYYDIDDLVKVEYTNYNDNTKSYAKLKHNDWFYYNKNSRIEYIVNQLTD